MLADMEQTVSPVFVGRGRETGLLGAALGRAGAGEPQAVLVGGEAGVGKTRLVEEFLAQAEADGAVTALGACLEVGAEGLPYAPLSAALRRLHRRLGPELDAAAAGLEGHLARLLPDFGEADGEGNDEYGRARLFEHTARMFERLTEGRTLVLAVEDLHWSDRSTRELLAYLVRTLHRSRVLIVATYRTDDLHRRHPLRPFLAELERLRTVQRLELERLDRPEVAAQLAGILGPDTPGRDVVDRIHRRSEGNPFFVEELATAYRSGCLACVTESLRDILLVRVEALPEETQRIVRIAAEGGSRIEHALLAAVVAESGAGGEDALISALRTAVGANILRPDTDGEGYRFRHALVREAVSDDLLPGERQGINRRFATVLEADPELVRAEQRTARLADYWYHAHQPARALPAALDAARDARRRNAFAEQLKMLERALELWDAVSEQALATTLRPYDWADTYPPCACDDGRHDGCDRLQLVDVLAEAVVAARRAGDRDRGQSLARRALSLVDETRNPLRAAWFRLQRAKMLDQLKRSGGLEEIQYAYRLVQDLGPSAVQAEALALEAAHGLLRNPGPEAVATAERAVAVARQAGAPSVEVHARVTLAGLLGDFDEGERAVDLLTEAVEQALPLGNDDVHTRGLNNLASLLLSYGRAEEAVTAARTGLDAARRSGLLLNTGPILTGNLAEALLAAGRTEEAAAVLADWDDKPEADTHGEFMDRLRGELALLRGDTAAAETHWAAAHASGGGGAQPQHVLPTAALGIRLAVRLGRPDQARARLAEALDGTVLAGQDGYLLPLLTHAAEAEADRHPRTPEGEAALARIADLAARLNPRCALHRGWAALLAGELARAAGRPTTEHRHAAVAELRAAALPGPLSLALLRAAEDTAAAGDRDRAAELLREAAELARRRGDLTTCRDADLLADRLGLGLRATPAHGTGDGLGLGLTPRERDVLRQLTLGRSNRQIAEHLFISPKTASVHVSNILAKLAVGGRGEAAALAHRLRLFPEEEPAAHGS
ncbi:helix-turn-helix transcriptional regulator [Kitasatospora phosalacinea]|uniref:Helix-turn-helix transcriptional regulator n=2 Tax=Kitasatospora phosalacinea TaxID=2065 RepID=A0A9W6Q654_9ACTN|nr:helix-turn-helix transcriptional regulator [Kitasatospora phosalacinea]